MPLGGVRGACRVADEHDALPGDPTRPDVAVREEADRTLGAHVVEGALRHRARRDRDEVVEGAVDTVGAQHLDRAHQVEPRHVGALGEPVHGDVARIADVVRVAVVRPHAGHEHPAESIELRVGHRLGAEPSAGHRQLAVRSDDEAGAIVRLPAIVEDPDRDATPPSDAPSGFAGRMDRRPLGLGPGRAPPPAAAGATSRPRAVRRSSPSRTDRSSSGAGPRSTACRGGRRSRPVASTSPRPRYSAWARPHGRVASPRTRSRNRASFSTTSTPRPARARTPASIEPAIPPPTTMTSWTFSVAMPTLPVSRGRGRGARARTPARRRPNSAADTSGCG